MNVLMLPYLSQFVSFSVNTVMLQTIGISENSSSEYQTPIERWIDILDIL